MFDVSVCIATHERPAILRRTLESVCRQASARLSFEVIVVDDGPTTDETLEVCREFPVEYFRIGRCEGEAAYRNPARPRNFAMRRARGRVLVMQSDDVLHVSENAIESLHGLLERGFFVIGTVWNAKLGEPPRRRPDYYTHPTLNARPLFFLGAAYRRDVYAVGGNDESFDEPGYEDDFFARCLMDGLGLKPFYTEVVKGIHQDHPRPALREPYRRMRAVYERRVAECQAAGKWIAAGGPWPYDEESRGEERGAI